MTVWNPIIWRISYFSEVPSGDQVQFPDGGAGTPGVTFRGANSTGFYYTGSGIGATIAGTLRLTVTATGITVAGDVGAVNGVFSGNVSVVNGNFSGDIQQSGNNVVDTNRLVLLRVFVVSALPASPPDGATAFVSDSTQTLAAGIGTAVVGGSTNHVPVYSDQGTWKIG